MSFGQDLYGVDPPDSPRRSVGGSILTLHSAVMGVLFYERFGICGSLTCLQPLRTSLILLPRPKVLKKVLQRSAEFVKGQKNGAVSLAPTQETEVWG